MATDSEAVANFSTSPPGIEQCDDFPYVVQLQTLKELK